MDINLQSLINRVTTLENLLQRLLRYLNPTGGGNGDSNNYQTQIDNLQDEINGLKKIFLVHGEKDAQEFLENYLKENGFKDVQITKYGETYDLT